MAQRQRATAIIIDNGKICLFRRVKPGRVYWAFPGGNVEEGESVEEALVREIREELTLTVEKFHHVGTIPNVCVPAYATEHDTAMDVVCFYIDRWHGTPKLGGPEKEYYSEENQYHIEWMPFAELFTKRENVFPTGVVEMVKELNFG